VLRFFSISTLFYHKKQKNLPFYQKKQKIYRKMLIFAEEILFFNIMQLPELIAQISATHDFFKNQAARQVDTMLTLRNWLIGFYLVEYEQRGIDRAAYGEKLLVNISKSLQKNKVTGYSVTNLKLYRQLYSAYPLIGQTLSDQFKHALLIGHFALKVQVAQTNDSLSPDINLMLTQLSFSHFIEFLKCDTPLQRAFYEIQSLQNQWTVRDLNRARTSLLYERTGLSTDKKSVLDAHKNGAPLQPNDVIRNPYILEFLGLEAREKYDELDLETAIINHLQHFLIELGQGFCFEARQKRITFDNTHYRIDLVFYHRILKCHVLIDLKIGDFTPADAGQMNMYLNHYKNEMLAEDDNPPIGIILCANKNETLVKYATSGLSEQVFVRKYLVNLPSEADLKAIIEAERLKM
jgi:predicted nuclease of restriction endonuclease-like (RecB) superfamily